MMWSVTLSSVYYVIFGLNVNFIMFVLRWKIKVIEIILLRLFYILRYIVDVLNSHQTSLHNATPPVLYLGKNVVKIKLFHFFNFEPKRHSQNRAASQIVNAKFLIIRDNFTRPMRANTVNFGGADKSPFRIPM